MGWIDITLATLTLVVGIILIIVVIMQESKTSSSTITGGNTFYGSNKGKTLDGVLSKYTVFLALVFIVLCVLTTISIMK